jgi:hypothetical protein
MIYEYLKKATNRAPTRTRRPCLYIGRRKRLQFAQWRGIRAQAPHPPFRKMLEVWPMPTDESQGTAQIRAVPTFLFLLPPCLGWSTFSLLLIRVESRRSSRGTPNPGFSAHYAESPVITHDETRFVIWNPMRAKSSLNILMVYRLEIDR